MPDIRLRVAAILTGFELLSGVRVAVAKSFIELIGPERLRPVGEALARSVARSIPLISGSPGFVYTFDPVTTTFTRASQVTGQLYLETPDPIGRGQWNLNLSYERVDIDEIDGMPLHDLRDVRFPIVDPDTGMPFTVPLFRIGLITHVVAAGTTVGLGDRADVNLTVPILYSQLGVRIILRDFDTGTLFPYVATASRFGIGDLLLRARLRLYAGDDLHLAGGLVLRLPSGNADDLQGTGTVELGPMLYAATRSFAPASWLAVQGYLNAGTTLDGEDVEQSEGRWGVGVDGRITERATVGAAVLARHAFSRTVPAGFFDVERIDPRNERRLVAPLLGIHGRRADYYDVSVGARIDVWRNTVSAFANVIVPANEDGFRAEAIPLVGVEAAF